ncbi:uncharacterized protein LOC113295508 [Papaver somniferum]|uniref:uncharacterized protein LOC113295508 n=1 Tax=Papaver somniferum TaxID=3469 RepID=UPI000E7058E1|nr:uncharacterized protein LOC113295508 [Papaver somniferum]
MDLVIRGFGDFIGVLLLLNSRFWLMMFLRIGLSPLKVLDRETPCLLSSFMLVVDILAKLLEDSAQDDIIGGFQVVEGGTVASHLQFAVIFLNSSNEEARRFLVILVIFEVLTGLKLNLKKSTITSIGADNLVEELALKMGCRTADLPITYLGMQKRLAVWKNKDLNKVGRLSLIKYAFQSIPTYYLSVPFLPASVEKKLITIMRKFLWSATDNEHRMSWAS